MQLDLPCQPEFEQFSDEHNRGRGGRRRSGVALAPLGTRLLQVGSFEFGVPGGGLGVQGSGAVVDFWFWGCRVQSVGNMIPGLSFGNLNWRSGVRGQEFGVPGAGLRIYHSGLGWQV